MKKIKNFYYKLFANSIALVSKSKLFHDSPISGSLFLITNAMFFNVVFIWLIIQTHIYFGFTDFLVFDIIPNKSYNVFIHFVVLMYFPILFFNYLMISYKKQYLHICEMYPNVESSKITLVYYMVSAFSLVLYLIFVVL